MKAWFPGFFVLAFLLGTRPVFAGGGGRLGSSEKSSEPDLERRIQLLEQAVEQLQRKVFPQKLERVGEGSSSIGITCHINTPFDGNFSANAVSEAVARSLILEKCRTKTKNSIYCAEKEVRCEK